MISRLLGKNDSPDSRFRKSLPVQLVDATPANRLVGQDFSQETDLSETYSIKSKQDSVFRLY
jgi:hypothetical protein